MVVSSASRPTKDVRPPRLVPGPIASSARIVAQPLADRLVETFGLLEALEGLVPEVEQPHADREVAGDRGGCGTRQQHVATASQVHDPRRPVERRPEVVTAALLGSPRVKPGPDADVVVAEAALDGDRGAQRIRGLAEHRDDTVTGVLEHRSGVALDGVPDDRVVAFQRRAHRGWVVLPSARRSLDVGEEE